MSVVLRLRIDEHPLLQQLHAYTAALSVTDEPIIDLGNLRADLDAGPPTGDRIRPTSCRFVRMGWAQPAWMPADASLSSVNYFPPGGAGLGWHTDSARLGWRLYIGRPLTWSAGEFIYSGGSVFDRVGVAMAFRIARGELFWHAVRCPGPRFSVGINVTGEATARALGLR
jgi:hypothetical protein